MQSMAAMNRLDMFDEMGLGPLWIERHAQDGAGAIRIADMVPVDISQESLPDYAGDMPAIAAVADETASAVPDLVSVHTVAAMSWDALQNQVSQCRDCGLCNGRTKTVFGVGDQAAQWLFVGEGPGYNENIQGQPFVGAAGRLLDNMMASLGVQRGQRAYIANVVKCRPTDDAGKDRPPTAAEIEACLPYLRRQIALIQPQVIVALGKTAAVALLGLDMETPVSQLRGKVHRVNQIPMVATYHPAYLLRKPVDKSKAWKDLCLARAQLPQ
jgi:uracil-DNA glycosylase family 4